MPRLEDLRKELSSLDPDELRERLRRIRQDRKISKVSTKVKKAVVKDKVKSTNALKNLSADELEALIKELDG